MKKKGISGLMVGLLCVASQVLMAAPTHLDIDLSGIGSPFELEIQLYSNSAPYNNSWARIDNVIAGTEAFDFEDGTLQGFDNSLNSSSVNAIAGTITGVSAYVLEILEDPAYPSTITFRQFSDPSAMVLSLDLLTEIYGDDELVLKLLDPDSDTGAPMLEGLNGLGDVLRVTALGIQCSNEVSTVVPVPGALALGLLGLGGAGALRRRGIGH